LKERKPQKFLSELTLVLIFIWTLHVLQFNIAGNDIVLLLANKLLSFVLITATALKALENNHNTDPKCEDVDTLYLIGEATSTSQSTNKRQTTSTSTSPSNSHRPPDIRSSKKM
jgi:hypothetical protein